jgi:hypothetical protein
MPETEKPIAVELMRTLDEKFVANRVMFSEAQLAASVVLEGASLRSKSGELDRDMLERLIESSTWKIPVMRTRLKRMPLGLTAPAWVRVKEIPLAEHIRYSTEPISATGELSPLWAGRGNGDMSIDRPLWDVLFSELDSGDLLATVRAHHALGDGMYGLRILDTLSASEPFEPEAPVIPPIEPTVPRTSLGILLHAYRSWLSSFPLGRAAWREYWRKPFRRRLRRTAGRMMRPFRERREAAQPFPEHLAKRSYRALEFDLADTKRRARELGGSVTHLIVAAAVLATGDGGSGSGEAAMLVPISRRITRNGQERNSVSMVRVVLPVDSELADAVASVRDQIAHAVETGETNIRPGDRWTGYVTYLPWQPRDSFFGRAHIKSVTMWPTIEPHERISFLASSYANGLRLAIIANEEIPVDEISAGITARVASPERLETA